jgi:glycosyltransferase involved in cell wall biosynthesis
MKVSALCAVFNCERYITEAIDSIRAQTVPVHEIVVVDDGSTDGTAEVVLRHAPDARLIRISHAGISSARQTAIDAAGGDLLAFIDADDIWSPDKTERQVALLRQRPDADVVYGRMRNFISPDLTPEEAGHLQVNFEPMSGLGASAVMFRRPVFERAPYHSADWQVGEFIDWCMRARAAGVVMLEHEEVVALRRIHRANSTRNRRQHFHEYLRIVKNALDRKRAQSPEAGRGEGES